MNEHRWAQLGKILAILAAITTVTLGGFQLIDRLKSPTVYGIVEFHNHYIHPRFIEMYEQRIENKSILDLISARRKKGDPPNKIIDAINDMASGKDDFLKLGLEMEFALARMMMVFHIKNDGSSLVREVKLVLPGEGQAEILEVGDISLNAKRVKWIGQIPLGDIRPKGNIEVIVWPKVMLFGNIASTNPAIVHAGGTGKIMELQGFYGWDADLVAWFLARGHTFQIIFTVVLIAGVLAMFSCALRRGFIVLKPKRESQNKRLGGDQE